MRRPVFRMERDIAMGILARAPFVHVATTTSEGAPVFRTMHGVLWEDGLFFHAGPKGEKTLTIGREAVVSAMEMVAEIPSWFTEPERACPATTYYESVQLHGCLERVDDLEIKAHVIQALMEQYQPSGGYRPITAEDEMYRKSLQGLLVLRISLEGLVGKSKMGQHLRPDKLISILEQLWLRGDLDDHKAIQRILAANPETPVPSFLQGPARTTLLCDVNREADLQAAARMLEGTYWNEDFSVEEIAESLRHSSALVGAKDAKTGTLIGVVRGVSDQSKHAWIYDVMVAPAWRGQGLGKAMMALLLAHPRMRKAKKLHLQTKDAQGLYESFGFCDVATLPPRSYTSVRMYCER